MAPRWNSEVERVFALESCFSDPALQSGSGNVPQCSTSILVAILHCKFFSRLTSAYSLPSSVKQSWITRALNPSCRETHEASQAPSATAIGLWRNA